MNVVLKRWVQLGEATTPSGRALLKAQFRVLQTQMPILGAVLCLSILSGIGGYGIPQTASWVLRLAVPAALLVVTGLRMQYWLGLRNVKLNPEQILAELEGARARALLLIAAYATWGLAIFEQADLGHRAYIAAFMFMGAIGFAYCLASLPAIVSPCLLLVTLPVIGRLLICGNMLLVCMGVNFALVLVLTMRMLNSYFEGFLQMVSSHTEVLAERERARRAEVLAKAEQCKAKKIADTDPLTNLANRRAFLASLEELIAERRHSQCGFAVVMLDLDGFKPINDSFGHHVGDAILQQVGERLSAIGDPGSIVARLGGDEFAILVPALSSASAVTKKAEELCAVLAMPFRVGQVMARLSGSCGAALFPAAGDDAGQLLQRADTALYDVKRRGRPGVAVFSHEMEDQLRRRSKIEQALRSAPAQASVDLLFQPILDLHTSKIRAFEALARWDDQQLGAVPPAEFIAVAEQAGFIGELADKLFEKAIIEASHWPTEVALSFNLSTLQLASPATPLKIVSAMSRHGFDPRRLQIEVTETALLADFNAARSTIELLRAVGVGIILDDFGAGYASIGYLREMAFDMIKIDGAMVEPIVKSHHSRALLKGMLDLCAAIGVPCIAEKVETAAHVKMLRELDCQCAQGYAFGKPMSGAEALQLASGLAQPLQLM